MTDLSALIERVESGTGSDRQLEIAICSAVFDATRHKGWWNFQAMRPRDEPEKPASEFWKRFGPSYTTSLDAVLSLIEAKLPEITDNSPADFLAGCIDEMMERGWRPDEPNGPQFCRAALSGLLRAIQESRNAER